MNSVDSSGWRNRAARSIVQLPGSGDRLVAELGSWRGRQLSPEEREMLLNCPCPACARNGLEGLAAKRIKGFCNRATHNLWVLLEEAQWLTDHLRAGSYQERYKARLNNSTYSRLIEWVVEDSGVALSKDGRQQR
jgi:7-cyano-7-deazaguanine tRNA-ribosyltransferase